MIKIYVCGPTVYSKAHIGNLKPIITFDIFIRSLKSLGKETMFVHNITDIDDKIINEAQKRKLTEAQIAQKYYEHYLNTLELYQVLKPDYLPRVTAFIPDIINFIQKLIDHNYAYESDGNVFFAIKNFPDYGRISQNNLEKLRNEEAKGKKNPGDFALWKNTGNGVKYNAPWSQGRPGWHTECAAFIDKFFNHQSLDWHGGGIDLIFPHHENENAQFQALNKKQITNNFMHIGLFNWENEKMAKSVGNILDVDQFAKKYGVDTLRMIILQSSLTAPVNLSIDLLLEAKKQVERFHHIFLKAQLAIYDQKNKEIKNEEIYTLFSQWKFAEAMRYLHQLIKNFNQNLEKETAFLLIDIFTNLGFSFAKKGISHQDVKLYRSWQEARLDKDFATADKLRKELKKRNLI